MFLKLVTLTLKTFDIQMVNLFNNKAIAISFDLKSFDLVFVFEIAGR